MAGEGHPESSSSPDQSRDLATCLECHADYVCPMDWENNEDGTWRVKLRCGECEHRTVGDFDQDTLDRLDITLDGHTAIMIDDLADFAQVNMEEEVERFMAAIKADQILPEDF